jgi:hypothetical protein
MKTKATLQFRASSPVILEGNLPIRLGEQRKTVSAEPLSATIDFPKIAAANLPRYLSRDLLRDGVLNGKIVLTGTLPTPKLTGEIQLANGRPAKLPIGASTVSGKLILKGETNAIEALKVTAPGVEATFHGDVDFRESDTMITLTSDRPLFDVTPPGDVNCVTDLKVVPATGAAAAARPVQELSFVGSLTGGPWSLLLAQTITQDPGGISAPSQIRPVMFCGDVKGERHSMILAVEPPKPTPRPRTKRR